MDEYTHYQEYGKGETLVLLPSNWLTSRSYEVIAQKLAGKYRVIVPDLYRGLSKFNKNAFTVADYVRKLHFFLESRNITSFYLVGVSFSGLIASEYIYLFPQELKKVMLVNSIAPIGSSIRKNLTFSGGFIGYMKLFYHNAFSLQGIKINTLWILDAFLNYFLRHPKQFFLDTLIATNKLKVSGSIIPVPTKMLIASKDEFIPYETYANIRNIHNLEVETIDGYHTWFFLNEDLLVEKIIDFFTK